MLDIDGYLERIGLPGGDDVTAVHRAHATSIPFGPGDVHEQAGWRFRVVQEGPEFVLQAELQEGWTDLYGFGAQPVPPVDLEVSNWFTCTHPRSPFVTGLVASTQRADGLRTSLRDWAGLSLTEATPLTRSVTSVSWSEVPDLLANRFAQPQFALGPDGRIALDPDRRMAVGPDGRIASRP